MCERPPLFFRNRASRVSSFKFADAVKTENNITTLFKTAKRKATMARFEFRDDDDDDETDCDSPSNEQWDKQQHRNHFQRNHYGEEEEGEIIEDESSSDNEMDEGDHCGNGDHNDNPDYNFRQTLNNIGNDGNGRLPEEESPEGEGNEEYRLIASSKYDRNYDRSDFYPSGIESSNSYGSNRSNSYSNHVSDDDENDVPDQYTYRNEGGIRSQQHANGTLVRSSSSQNSSSVAPEVHYHIYVSEQQAFRWFDSSENPRLQGESFENQNGKGNNRRRFPLWKWITLLAGITQLIVILVGRYDLISPPPSFLTWEEYGSHQFRLFHKVSKEGCSLLKHLARATVLGAFSKNNDDETDRYLSPRFAFPQTWKSFAPTEDFASQNTMSRKTAIFGQEEALDHLRNGLGEWSSSQNLHPPTKQEPLIVYISGGRGVGKRSVAYLLLEQLEPYDSHAVSVLKECASSLFHRDGHEETTPREYHCPLLHLTHSDYLRNQCFDYLDEDYDADYGDYHNNKHDDVTNSPSYQMILDHVVSAGGGASIVLLEKVDSPTLPMSWLSDLMSEISSQRSIFGNTIFVLTSQVGTNTVGKWTRKRLQSLQGVGERPSVAVAGSTDVEGLLRYELNKHHEFRSDEYSRDTTIGIENWLLVPMAPLDKNAMASILHNVASSNQNLPMLLTESASERILEALEWHQWIHKTTGDVLRIWSPDGVPPLLELWEERVLLPIAKCERVTSAKQSFVLDFEGSSTDRLWLRTCELVTERYGHFDVKSGDGRLWNCHGASCSFYL